MKKITPTCWMKVRQACSPSRLRQNVSAADGAVHASVFDETRVAEQEDKLSRREKTTALYCRGYLPWSRGSPVVFGRIGRNLFNMLGFARTCPASSPNTLPVHLPSTSVRSLKRSCKLLVVNVRISRQLHRLVVPFPESISRQAKKIRRITGIIFNNLT